MQLITQIIASCTSFKSYQKIYKQKFIHSFIYFLLIVIVSHLFIYPHFFKQKKDIIFPIFNTLEKEFPKIKFINYKIAPDQNIDKVIEMGNISFIIDSKTNSNKNSFSPIQVTFRHKELHILYENYDGKTQSFAYSNPTLAILLSELSNFKNGSGVLNGVFFLKLKTTLEAGYFSYGIIFLIITFISTLIFNYLLSIIGFFYSKMIQSSLSWKEIRNISFYAITPVLLLKVITTYLNINSDTLSPIFFFAYSLFLCRAISEVKRSNTI